MLLKTVEKKYIFYQSIICVYDVKLVIITTNEEDRLTISIVYMVFKSQFFGLIKKNQNRKKEWFSV